jgi:hypothetical protein
MAKSPGQKESAVAAINLLRLALLELMDCAPELKEATEEDLIGALEVTNMP